MKKLFHLGIVALIAITVVSCSKSAADLTANENSNAEMNYSGKKGISSPNQGNGPSAPIFNEPWSKFYPFINQPIDYELGSDDGTALYTGQIAVFYIVLSDEMAEKQFESAKLTTTDSETGMAIGSYDLISYSNSGMVDILIPEALEGKYFMFAIVPLDLEYTDRTVTLSSYLEYNGSFSSAQIDRAFSVISE